MSKDDYDTFCDAAVSSMQLGKKDQLRPSRSLSVRDRMADAGHATLHPDDGHGA
jgi:hypothetical protein